MKRILCMMFLVLLTCTSAQAALLSRLAGQAYYDTDLNITWVADANLAATNGFGVSGINADGPMSWDTAQSWIAAMNTANYLGVSGWRLPKVVDTGTPGCDFAFTGTDCGWNVDLATGEMAHLFYGTLANAGIADTSGNPTGCSGTSPFCLTNSGPFANFPPASTLTPSYYWTGTEYAPDTTLAWDFRFATGKQDDLPKSDLFYAWAVLPGDIAAVPVPATAWLIAPAFGLLAPWVRRKAAN